MTLDDLRLVFNTARVDGKDGIRAVVEAVCGEVAPYYLRNDITVEYGVIKARFRKILTSDGDGKAAGGPSSNEDTVTAPRRAAPATDFAAHLARQRAFSERAFGPGERVEGVSDHIRKELLEVSKAEPGHDRQREWIDVVMLALDGAWRSGMSPDEIIAGLRFKLDVNERRAWPDWRTADPNKAIEHDRAKDAPAAAPVCDVCRGTGKLYVRTTHDFTDAPEAQHCEECQSEAAR